MSVLEFYRRNSSIHYSIAEDALHLGLAECERLREQLSKAESTKGEAIQARVFNDMLGELRAELGAHDDELSVDAAHRVVLELKDIEDERDRLLEERDKLVARAEDAESERDQLLQKLVRIFKWEDPSFLHAILHVENAITNTWADLTVEKARTKRASLAVTLAEEAFRNMQDDRDALALEIAKIEDQREALAAELTAIRSVKDGVPTDEELRSVYDLGGSPLASRRALYNLGRHAVEGEVARMREELAALKAERDRLEVIEVEALHARVDLGAVNEGIGDAVRRIKGEVLKLRARVAELESKTPAPHGLPVATDRELSAVFLDAERAARKAGAHFADADFAGVLAVAARVRAEPHDRPVSTDRETLGRIVRKVWIDWAKEQPSPKDSWLVPWEGLAEPDKEVDRRIGETIARYARSSGTPVATRNKLLGAYTDGSIPDIGIEPDLADQSAHANGLEAVAGLVRSEACLVTRAVELGCNVDLKKRSEGCWDLHVGLGKEMDARADDVYPEDVPQGLSDLLGYVKGHLEGKRRGKVSGG